MVEILHKLGIDTPNIIAQMLVFGIVYAILSKYAFGPVTALLEERRRRGQSPTRLRAPRRTLQFGGHPSHRVRPRPGQCARHDDQDPFGRR